MAGGDPFSVDVERRIDAAPETVFSFFTDAERYRRWQGVDAELDPRPGGLFRIRMTDRGAAVARGTYLVLEPPHRLVFTWGWEPSADLPDVMRELPPGGSTVEVTFVPDGGGTLLRLRHSGLMTPDSQRFHAWGWGVTLDRLVLAGTGRDPGPSPLEDPPVPHRQG